MKQALRPFPQYTLIDTFSGQGDHSGHSSYHAAIIQLEKRYSNGLSIPDFVCFLEDYHRCRQLLGQQPTNSANGCCLAANQYNRSLEKSIGQFDQLPTILSLDLFTTCHSERKAYLTHGPALGFSEIGASAAF